MFGFQSGYAEDIKVNKKVQRFTDEFSKFSPDVTPVDLDEEDPDEGTGIFAPVESKSDIVYGKKIDSLAQNSINLQETAAGREEILKAAMEKPKE